MEEKRQPKDYDNWEDRHGYFEVKRRKLQDQFDALGPQTSTIFSGVTIYVNGWTDPDASELRCLIHAHGGGFVYSDIYAHAKPTHVIATNLPDAKVRSLGDTMVCSPDWIVESVAAKRQLPVERFRLYARTAGQRRLSFGRDSAAPTREGGLATPPFGEGVLDKHEGGGGEGGSCELSSETTSGVCPVRRATEAGGVRLDEQQMEAISFSFKNEMYGRSALHTSTASTTHATPTISSLSIPPSSLLGIDTPEVPSTLGAKPSHEDHLCRESKSTRGSDFVSEFYAHSRLHHLSTWSTEMKQFASQAVSRIHPKYPKLPATESLAARKRRLVVHLDLDCFFVSVSLRDKPHLAGQPVAVTHAKLPSSRSGVGRSLDSKAPNSTTASKSLLVSNPPNDSTHDRTSNSLPDSNAHTNASCEEASEVLLTSTNAWHEEASTYLLDSDAALPEECSKFAPTFTDAKASKVLLDSDSPTNALRKEATTFLLDPDARTITLHEDTSTFSLPEGHTASGSTEAPTGGSLPKHLLESMSDIASCSYEARRCGVRNGMQVGRALSLCPKLQFLPYEFDQYRAVSQRFYEIVLSYSSTVEAVSCDEAYIELTEVVRCSTDAEDIVQEMRDEIRTKTGCTVSAGISQNMFLARMSTRRAKPNGQFYLKPEEVDAFLSPQPVRDLPGVGHSLGAKLKELRVETCGDLKTLAEARLQSEFGPKTGHMLFQFARGVDERSLRLTPDRKSLSVDINYGIRFSLSSEAESLVVDLSAELERRAQEAAVQAGTVTLKLKIRRPNVPVETRKYLGHGSCDNVSRSTILLEPIQTAAKIAKMALQLLRQLKPVPADLRGMGIQLSRLVPNDGGGGERGGGGESPAKARAGDLRSFFGRVEDTGPGEKGQSSRAVTSLLLTSSTPPPLPNLPTHSHAHPTSHTHPANCDHFTSHAHASASLYNTSSPTHPSATPLYNTSSHTHSSATPLYNTSSHAHSSATPPHNTSVMDESFVIDLPPASQLDTSVLTSLPPSLAEKILEGYSKRQQLLERTSGEVDREGGRELEGGSDEAIVPGQHSSEPESLRAASTAQSPSKGKETSSVLPWVVGALVQAPSAVHGTRRTSSPRGGRGRTRRRGGRRAPLYGFPARPSRGRRGRVKVGGRCGADVLPGGLLTLHDALLLPPVSPPSVDADEPKPLESSNSNCLHNDSSPLGDLIVIKDDLSFLSDARAYLRDWVDHFPDGPLDDDTEKVNEFLLHLLRSNRFVLLAVLRFLRRLLLSRPSEGWFPTFNALVSSVQGSLRADRNCTLPIANIPL